MALRKLVVFIGIPIITLWVGYILIQPRFGANLDLFREAQTINALCATYADLYSYGKGANIVEAIEAITGDKPLPGIASEGGLRVPLWRFFILEQGLLFLPPESESNPDPSGDPAYTYLGECLYSYDTQG